MVAIFALLDSISAGIAFFYYATVCFWRSLRDDSKSGKSDRWDIKNLKKLQRQLVAKPKTWLNLVQMFATLATFILCVSQAIVLARAKGDGLTMQSDSDVSAILFGSLVWLVWFLSLAEDSNGAGHEQYVPWMLFCVSYATSAGLTTSKLGKLHLFLAMQWTRVLLSLLLVLSVPAFRKRENAGIRLEDHPVEETRPLVGATEQQADSEETRVEDESDEDEDEDEDDEDDDRSVVSDVSHTSKDDKFETDAQKEEKSKRKALRDRPWWEYLASFSIFLPFVRPRTWQQYCYLSVMIFHVLVARAVTLGLPLVLGAIIDQLGQHKFSYSMIFAFVGLRFASSSSGVSLIKNLVLFRWNNEQHDALVVHTYDHVMSLSADYHSSKSTPNTYQMLERGMSVVTLLQDILFDHLPVIADLIIALFVVSKLFGAYLCYAVALTMILLSWSNRVSMAKKTRMRRYYVDVWRNWFGHMSESFMHWRTVSEFNRLSHEKNRHRQKTAECSKTQLQSKFFHLSLSALQEVVLTTGFAFVCVLAAKEIAAGRLEVGRFVVLITYWSQIMSPVTKLTGIASKISEQLVDAEKLLILLEKKPTISFQTSAPQFEFRGGHVKVENCTFSYDEKRVVTNNVSFEALPGQTVAFVGETGGGKSTIFNLLFRFFNPSSGRVIVDGQDISQVNLESYRTVLGLVPQNPVLFNTTILKNVRYGRLVATKSEVVAACKASQFHEKVQKFPKKYRQKVGELSQKLSGGELQRLAIARAIIKDPGILLLDEATSAVDSVTETKIQDSLDRLSKGRTTFVIAHRLSTIMHADKILVVRGGEIVESGTHTELLEHGNGAYKELWEAQLKLSAGKEKVKDGSAESAEGGEKGEEKGEDLLSFDEIANPRQKITNGTAEGQNQGDKAGLDGETAVQAPVSLDSGNPSPSRQNSPARKEGQEKETPVSREEGSNSKSCSSASSSSKSSTASTHAGNPRNYNTF